MHDVRRARMLLEVRGEALVDERLHRRLDLGVAELGLGLTFELRLANLHREHRGEAFAHVVAGQREVRLLEEVALGGVRVDDARQRRLEAGEVRAAFVRVDVVDEREDVLVVAVVVLHGELDADVVARRLDVDDFGVQRLAGRVQVLHELLEAALRVEGLGLFLAGALVGERDHHALVQERELAQAHRQRVVAIDEIGEDHVVGLEPDLRAGLFLRDVAQHLELGRRVAAREVHVVLFAVALDPDLELLGQRVDDRHADAVQTARHLVAVLVELAAGVQHRHRELDARHLFRRMHVDRNAATVVLDGDRIVGVDRDANRVRVAGERFVDRVVDDFVDEMMQAALGRRADVHAGAFANRLESLEYLDLPRVVLLLASRPPLCIRH